MNVSKGRVEAAIQPIRAFHQTKSEIDRLEIMQIAVDSHVAGDRLNEEGHIPSAYSTAPIIMP